MDREYESMECRRATFEGYLVVLNTYLAQSGSCIYKSDCWAALPARTYSYRRICYLLLAIQNVATYRYLTSPEPEIEFAYIPKKTTFQHVAQITAFPYHVLIVYSSYYCSGSLVRSQVVVSAASCFIRRKTEKIIVKVGAHTITEPGQVIPVIELKRHEYFNHRKSWKNDIALLALEHHVEMGSKVKKIILMESETALRPGTIIDVSGWGHSDLPEKYRNNLLWTQMTVLDERKCREFYENNLMTTSNYCARYHYGYSLSDNGGGAVFNNLLVGILSFGAPNSNITTISVFTNVSYFHRWITLNSRRYLEKYCRPLSNENNHKYAESASQE